MYTYLFDTLSSLNGLIEYNLKNIIRMVLTDTKNLTILKNKMTNFWS